MCGCLHPAQKRGLGGVGKEASIAPYPIVWDPAGSFPPFGLFAWEMMGDRASPLPYSQLSLGNRQQKIIQYEQRRLEAVV